MEELNEYNCPLFLYYKEALENNVVSERSIVNKSTIDNLVVYSKASEEIPKVYLERLQQYVKVNIVRLIRTMRYIASTEPYMTQFGMGYMTPNGLYYSADWSPILDRQGCGAWLYYGYCGLKIMEMTRYREKIDKGGRKWREQGGDRGWREQSLRCEEVVRAKGLLNFVSWG